MRRKAEIIVRGEINDALAIEGAKWRLLIVKHAQIEVRAFGSEVVELVTQEGERISAGGSGCHGNLEASSPWTHTAKPEFSLQLVRERLRWIKQRTPKVARIPVSISPNLEGASLIFLRTLLLILISVYVLILIVAIFTSEQLIFQPQPPGYRDSAAILKLTSSDGAKISATYLPNPAAIFTVLFSHGNAEDIGYDASLLQQIRDSGFSVLAYDYQGYGTSEGKPPSGMPTTTKMPRTTIWCKPCTSSRAESYCSVGRLVPVQPLT